MSQKTEKGLHLSASFLMVYPHLNRLQLFRQNMFNDIKYNIHHDNTNIEVLTVSPVLVNQQIFTSKVHDDRMKSLLLQEVSSKVSKQHKNQHDEMTRLLLLSPIKYNSQFCIITYSQV